MWPFECREISTFREVWTLVIPFLEGKSKIGLREAVDQVPYCQYKPSVLSSTRKCRRRYTWKCTFMGNCQKFKWSVTLTLTLDRVKVTSTHSICRTTCRPNHVTVALRSTEIWPFEFRKNIEIRRSLNSRDSFFRWKFKNRAPTSCSPGPILWPPTISFELHADMAEEIYLEMCTYGQLSEVQCSVTLTLTLDQV